MGQLRHSDYKIGWICALPIEGAAAVAMLDETHPTLDQSPSDYNSYVLGRIGKHNVVIACLPLGRMGTHNAAVVAAQMVTTFDSIKLNLMVGVAGGIPSKKYDIRLGDIVVSRPGSRTSGVVQWDFGRTVEDGRFENTTTADATSPALLTTLTIMKIRHYLCGNTFPQYISKILDRMLSEFKYPGADQDKLFQVDYDHASGETCDTCDINRLVPREPRVSSDPVVHYGTVLTANSVMKHGPTRDKTAAKFDALCFEMEAAGLMSYFRPAVIRGICDYSDTHKNKEWQPYAALAAAAYAKELLQVIPPERTLNPVPGGDALASSEQTTTNETAKQMPTTVFSVQITGLINTLVDLSSFFIDSVERYVKTHVIASDLVETLKSSQKILHEILLVMAKTSVRFGTDFEQNLEEQLSKLHKSLVKAYQEGVDLQIFSLDPSNSRNLNTEYWLNKTGTRFLQEYEAWEVGIQVRLRAIRTSPDAERVLTEQNPKVSPARTVASRKLITYKSFNTSELVRLPCSWVSCEPSSPALIEFRCYSNAVALNPTEFRKVTQAIEDTVLLLQGETGDSLNSINLPKCRACYHDIAKNRFVLTHAFPKNHGQPRSLRDRLTDVDNYRHRKSLAEVAASIGAIVPNNPEILEKVLGVARSDRNIRHPLDHRLRLATQLASSVLYLHSGGLVHKRICPETVILLTHAGGNKYEEFPYALGDPLVVGFDRTRSDDTVSNRVGESDMADCLYQHPDRWGKTSGFQFTMRHDIYSLGVVLLEIALWDSMIIWLPSEFRFPRKRYIAWRDVRNMFDLGSGMLRPNKTARDVQDLLINYARRNIPPVMGQGYTDVVVACLSGKCEGQNVDGFNEGGNGIQYMIHVISKLEKLQLS